MGHGLRHGRLRGALSGGEAARPDATSQRVSAPGVRPRLRSRAPKPRAQGRLDPARYQQRRGDGRQETAREPRGGWGDSMPRQAAPKRSRSGPVRDRGACERSVADGLFPVETDPMPVLPSQKRFQSVTR